MSSALWLVPLLPLAGAVVNGLAGRRLTKQAVWGIACGMPILSFLLSIWICERVSSGGPIDSVAVPWIELIPGADLALRADPLSVLMMLVVTGIGSLIHIYSIGYMKDDPAISRYFCYLNLFTFAMLILVMSNNMVLMFVGWEGVGLCSYLLIGFWFTDGAKADAGKKAFIVNRIGDLGFILGIFFCATIYGTVNFEAMGTARFAAGGTLLLAPALLLFLGVCGKSAQIPLYVWLPDAMAGPTPVSALIHAATMVTAGVYMLCRLDFLFQHEAAAWATQLIGGVAGATALLAAVIAVAQYDIKKILAYSTISQLGFMICGAAAGGDGVPAAMTHLTTHAFFKALLFLAAGAVIVACNHEQDIRRMGGLWKKIPAIAAVFLIGTLSMGGPLAGMFSKEAVMEAVYVNARFTGVWALLVITAFLTPFYIGRLFVVVFLGEPGERKLHPVGRTMMVPLFVLAVASMIPFLWSRMVHTWLGYGWLLHIDKMHIIISVGTMLVGYGLALRCARMELTPLGKSFVYALIENRFYVDEIYDRIVVRPVKLAATGLWMIVDRFVIDHILVEGPPRAVTRAGRWLQQGHPGSVNIGVGAILMGVLFAFITVIFMMLYA